MLHVAPIRLSVVNPLRCFLREALRKRLGVLAALGVPYVIVERGL